MYKLLALIILLSTKAYAECGKEAFAVINYNSKTQKASMEHFFKFEREFCDAGKNELNANVAIALLDENKKVLDEKKVFFTKFLISEKMGKNDPYFFEKTKIAKTAQFYNVKFSVSTDASKIKFYKISSLEDGKVLGEGPVK
jgi:hypothetical protein